MRLVKFGDRIVNLDRLTDAEYIPPENSETGEVGLTLWFGDNCWIGLCGDEAERMWSHFSRNSKTVPLQTPQESA